MPKKPSLKPISVPAPVSLSAKVLVLDPGALTRLFACGVIMLDGMEVRLKAQSMMTEIDLDLLRDASENLDLLVNRIEDNLDGAGEDEDCDDEDEDEDEDEDDEDEDEDEDEEESDPEQSAPDKP